MKKYILSIFAICLLISQFAGCGELGHKSNLNNSQMSDNPVEDHRSLRVLVDVEFGSSLYLDVEDELRKYKAVPSAGGEKTIGLVAAIKDAGGSENIQLEFPPKCGEERDIYLSNLRTEIMAGGGPDVFVCLSGIGFHFDKDNNFQVHYVEPIFRFPQQAMKRNMFLPLDNYIKTAKHMEWDKLTQVVMKAGRTEKGQMLLPMTYTVPTTLFRKSDVKSALSKEMKWDDMFFQDTALGVAAVSDTSTLMGSALAPLADFENDKLAFSEEDLTRFCEKITNHQTLDNDNTIPHFRFNLKVLDSFKLNDYNEAFKNDDSFTLVPLYSRNGGYMATVTSFVGINANAENPEAAFSVVDYLLGEECQRSKLYAFMTYDNAVPTLDGLMTQGTSVSTGNNKKWTMPDPLYNEFCAVRDNIKFSEFATPLERELQQLYIDLTTSTSKSKETMIHDAYMRMNMELAES